MLLEPPIEQLSEKVGNKYTLCNLVAKRAKQIQKQNFENEINPEVKEITQAAEEVFEGKVVIDKD